WHLPSRFEDRRVCVEPADVRQPGRYAVRGRLSALRRRFTRRRGLRLHDARIEAGGASLRVVWFNQPWLATQIVGDVEYLFYGDVRTGRDGTLELVNPS